MAYGAGEANKAAAWEQYLQNHNVNHQLQLQDILRETEPPTESKKKEGSGKRKTKRNRTILPRLRKVSYKNKKHRYRLKDPFSKRKKAIHEGVKMEAEMKGRSIKKAAIAKKGRFNVLRIYRRNKKIKECNTITHDMRYMDKKYGLGKTKNICGKKGGRRKKGGNDEQRDDGGQSDDGGSSEDGDYLVIPYAPGTPPNNQGTVRQEPRRTTTTTTSYY